MMKEQYSDETVRKGLEELLKQQREQEESRKNEDKTDWDQELALAERLERSTEKLLRENMKVPFVASDLYHQVILRYMTQLIARLGIDIAKLQNDVDELRKH